MNIPEWVEQLVNAGVSVTIEKSDKLGVYFDLNLQSKSHMYLYQQGENWFVDMRYDETVFIEDFDDLLWAAKAGMHGRDFINHAWADLLIEYGILKKNVETKVSYS